MARNSCLELRLVVAYRPASAWLLDPVAWYSLSCPWIYTSLASFLQQNSRVIASEETVSSAPQAFERYLTLMHFSRLACFWTYGVHWCFLELRILLTSSPALISLRASAEMDWINTLREFEYDRTHSDAVYEPPPNLDKNGPSPDSSQGGNGSEVQPIFQSEVKESSTSDTSRRRRQSQEETKVSSAKTASDPFDANAKKAAARSGPGSVVPRPNERPFSGFADSSSLLVGLLLLSLILSIWYLTS